MERRFTFSPIIGILLSVLLLGLLGGVFRVGRVKAAGTIYIRADGSIDPPTANITTLDNRLYTFFDDNQDEVAVERNNTVVDAQGYSCKGFSLWHVKNVTLKNMVIHEVVQTLDAAINITRCQSITIYNATISGIKEDNDTYFPAVMVESSTETVVEECNLNQTGGITFWYCNHSRISSNNINDTLTPNTGVLYGAWGVILGFCANITVNDNYILNTTSTTMDDANEFGVFLHNCSRVYIQDNHIKGHGGGIFLSEGSYNNEISGNTLRNKKVSIQLDWFSFSNVVCQNNISNQKEGYGIVLMVSNHNIICENWFRNLNSSILMSESLNNTFYFNRFINITNDVWIYEPGYANHWNTSYTLGGGNYWDDYQDEDIYSGPFQNETGSDGIWDHPYVIDEDNVDHYPIIPEFPTPFILPLFIITSALVVVFRRKNKT